MSTHTFMSVFCILKYSHHSIIIAKSFGHTFSATASFQFVSWRVCIMAVARAGAITAAAKAVSKSCENEKRHKSAARTCKWRECQSGERRSEIRQTDLTGHAEGCTCLSEEQHAENGAHHLNLLLLNNFCSNFVFVITYHAARRIIERPCHLLSHAVNNSKLTTLPQSHPSWQSILEARWIIERLAKDPVSLFHNMTWFILGHA